MTYFGVLLTFILPPLALLLVITPRDLWLRLFLRRGVIDWKPYLIILAHVLMALVYTTPWDNYLVATNVWWYDPALVTGVRLGYVPIEEYTFFVVQTLLSGLWTLFLIRFVIKRQPEVTERPRLRYWSVVSLIAIFIISVGILLSGWKPGVYMALILGWAVVPLLVQTIFGADILLANWRLLLPAIAIPTLYLWLIDSLSISSGTWTIDPAQTTGLKLGPLPFEEMLFFFITNLIIGCGVTLMVSPVSQERARQWLAEFRSRSQAFWQANPINRWLRLLQAESPARTGWLWSVSLFNWLAILIATPIAIWIKDESTFPSLASLGVLVQFVVTLLALTGTWSSRRIILVTGVILVAAWSVEAIGVSTGLPFGHYHYSELLQPQLLDVPLLVPMAWMMMLPPAWGVTSILLSGMRVRWQRFYWLIFAILGGIIFTAWDLYLDPQMAARNLWIWETSGGFFGIPWSNYAGWWLVSSLITLLIRPANLPSLHLLTIYSLTWLFQAIGLGIFWGQPGPALAGFAGMGIFALSAWIKESNKWKSSSGRSPDLSADPSPTQ